MPVRSPHPDVDVPAVSLVEFLFGDGTGLPDVPAFVDATTGTSVTYPELYGQVLRIAAALAQRGIGRGDVVGLHAPNSPAWAAVFHGVLRANAIVTSVNVLATADDIAKQLVDSRARLLVTAAPLAERAIAAAKQAGLDDEAVVVIDGDGPSSLDALLATTAEPPAPAVGCRRHRRAALLLRHRRAGQGRDPHPPQPRREPPQVHPDRHGRPRHRPRRPSVLPHLRHDGADEPGHPPPRDRRDDAPVRPRRSSCGSPSRVQRVFIVPPMAVALAKHPAVDALRPVVAGDDHVSAPRRSTASSGGRRAPARLPGDPRLRHDGAEPGLALHPFDRHDLDLGSVGLPLPNMEARSSTRRPARSWPPARSRGAVVPRPERHVRLPRQPRGDGRDPRRRRLAAHRRPRDRDADGVFTIVDRLKELIKYKGYQVPPPSWRRCC